MRYGALLGTALLVASTARAATFTVNNLNDSGPESLRARIAEANASPGPDTINFSVTGTITLTSGQLQITDALTIVGPGAANLTVDGNANNRIFLIDVASPAACPAPTTPTNYAVTISGLTLQNARRNSDNSGGAIWSAHDLTVDSVVVQNNQAKSGAGISFLTQYANQKLMIKNSLFQNNIAKPLSSPVTGSQHGGAFRVVENCRDPINLNTAIPAIVDVSNSEFKANRAQPVLASAFGAAIFADAYADITISDSRIVGNQIDVPDPPVANQVYQGAGIRAQARSLTIVRSEIANNVVLDATGSDATRAGGIDVLLLDPLLQVSADAMTVAIVNSTVSDNSVSANAGGIRALGNVALELDNSTVSSNRAAPHRTGGVQLSTTFVSGSTTVNAAPPTMTMVSSILANSDDTRSDLATNTTLMPTFTLDATNSLIESICGSCNITVSGSGNKLGTDPLLGPLTFNGGLTKTRAPMLGSPVIGAGSNPLALTTDQRGAGFPRTQGAATDTGAVEYIYPPDCVGFTDGVAGDSTFCPNVAWLKSRAITLGCTSFTTYCPGNFVNRLAMAAFMNRLGEALTEQLQRVQLHSGALDIDTDPIVCQTSNFSADQGTKGVFPRRALFDAVFSATASSDVPAALMPVVSFDGGTTWLPLNADPSGGHVKAGRWSNFRALGRTFLQANDTTVKFGLHIDRAGLSGSNQLTDSYCNVRVRFQQSNGISAR